MVIALLLAEAAAHPSPQAMRLGRLLAESGTLATLLPMIQQKETEELVADHAELSAAQKDRLRVVAKAVYQRGRERLIDAEAQSYARRMSLADLRAAVAFQNSPAGRHYRAAIPNVIMDTMKTIGSMDFKGDVRAAYCKETGKLCGK